MPTRLRIPAQFSISQRHPLLLEVLTRVAGAALLAAIVTAFSTGCDKPALARSSAAPTEMASTVTGAKSIKLDEGQLKSISVEVLKESPFAECVHMHGKVSFNEDSTAPILAPLAGQVTGLSVRVGDHVTKGQVLLQLKSREVATARSDFLEARKDQELAERTQVMTQELCRHQAASSIALQQAEIDLAKARTRVLRTQESLQVLGIAPPSDDSSADPGLLDPRIPIRAPLDGVVVDRHVTEGQFVPGDATALLTIADLSTLWVTADVFERDLHQVQLNQQAEVTTLAYPDDKFEARVSFVSSAVDPATRAIKLRLVVNNVDLRLKPEMFAQVNVFLSDPAPVVTVPARAVLSEKGRSYLYVKVGSREFADRAVTVAPAGADRLRVLSGVTRGDEVVTDGAMLLRGQQDGGGEPG